MRRSSNRSRCASEVLLGAGFDSTAAGRRTARRGSRDLADRATGRLPARLAAPGPTGGGLNGAHPHRTTRC
ncbi:hypothetical protein STRMOE7_16365 [Streptomyces sp. MOE7]|nr:hypothetical protein STRMOE7_16365 [Streptomyces sp. MOE7]